MPTPEKRNNPIRKTHLAGVLIALVAAIVSTTLSLIHMGLWLTAKTDTTIPEASIVFSILSWLNESGSLYRDYSQPPYTTTPYTPFFYILAGSLTKILGVTVENAYLAGRIVSFTSFFGSVFLVYRISRALGVDRSSAVLGALLAAGTPIVFPWSVSCRPDFLALALGLSGISCITTPSTRGRLTFWIAGVAWSLSFFTKQVFIAAPFAYFLWRIGGKREQTAAVPLASCVFISAIAALGMNQATHGMFFLNIFDANLASPSLIDVPRMILRALVPEFFIVMFLGLVGAVIIFRPAFACGKGVFEIKADLARLIILAATVSTIVFGYGVSKPGADQNYFYEPLFLWAIVATVAFHHAQAYSASGVQVAILCIFLTTWGTFRWVDNGLGTHRLALTLAAGQDIRELVHRTSGEILFISNGFGLRSGRGTSIYDGFNASYLEEQGKINLSSVARQIEDRHFSALLIQRHLSYYGYRITPATLEKAIVLNYQEVSIHPDHLANRELPPYRWLVPRQDTSPEATHDLSAANDK